MHAYEHTAGWVSAFLGTGIVVDADYERNLSYHQIFWNFKTEL